MFCFKCGKGIVDDAAFCQYCGTNLRGLQPTSTINTNSGLATQNNGSEFDRGALQIYLNNVLSLECLVSNYHTRVNRLSGQINKLVKDNYYRRFVVRADGYRSKYVHLFYTSKKCFILYRDGYPLTGSSTDRSCKWVEITPQRLASLNEGGPWVDPYAGFLERAVQRGEAADGFVSAYRYFIKNAPDEWAKNSAKTSELQKKLSGMKGELKEAEELLRQAYEVNIIPSAFRNSIHAIYYLRDFISTSRESFTTALLHLDLDEIKSKLDEIISQQQSIIIQNAVRIAQNDDLLKQNQQQLEHLAEIERNTGYAAQYAGIAASNSAICAWFGAASYIELRK